MLLYAKVSLNSYNESKQCYQVIITLTYNKVVQLARINLGHFIFTFAHITSGNKIKNVRIFIHKS